MDASGERREMTTTWAARGKAERSGEIVASGVCGCLCPIARAYLGEDVADVTDYGVLADEQLLGYLAIRLACGNEAQHLDLSLCQAIRVL